MPVTIKQKGGCFEVRTPSGVKAKCTTRQKAKAQARVLNMVERRSGNAR